MSLFDFRAGQSPVHRLDPRCKFFLICLVSISLLYSSLSACLICTGLVLALVRLAGISYQALAGQLKYFIAFLLLIILVQSLSAAGADAGPALVSYGGLKISSPGLVQGTLTALRFFLVMVLGLLFSATTRPAQIKAAVQWFLAPVPMVPETRVGVMVSLALRFLPLILHQASEVRDAIRARYGTGRKRPVRYALVFTLALLKKSFAAADAMSLAMEARCYSDIRTDPKPVPGGQEPLALGAGLVLCLTLVLV